MAGPRTVTLALHGVLGRDGPARFAAHAAAALDRGCAEVLICDVRGAVADAVTVEALARLQLAARRRGCRVRLRRPTAELLELLAFTGCQTPFGV